MQVICDPRDLNGTQRRAVADFILNFPSACAGSCGPKVEHVAAAEISDATSAVELATLQHDHESTMPVAAFGQPAPASVSLDPAAAFGGAQPAAPLAASIPPTAPASTVAPVPPVNTAPTTTTPGVASSGAGASSVDLDKHGLPWDNRIHAESKAKIADGTWRKKRNVDPGLVAHVEAELRQLMGAPAAPLAVSTALSVPTPPPVTGAPVTANLPTVSASPAVVPQPPTPQAPAAGDERQQFVALIGRTSAALQAGKITQEEINQCCQAVGVPALPLLANRLDLVANVAGSIDAIVASRP